MFVGKYVVSPDSQTRGHVASRLRDVTPETANNFWGRRALAMAG